MRDACARLTPLGVMVLSLLDEGDMHPYEMLRLLRHRRDDRIIPITNGTLYHTVSRLERAGLVAEVGIDREGNRPERTTYTLTEPGREMVIEWVRRELPRIDRPVEFRVALSEAHDLSRADAVELLNARRDALADEHRQYREGLDSTRELGVPEQFLIEVERQEVLLTAELGWMDDLIERVAHPDFPWGRAEIPPEHHDRYIAQRKAAQR